MKPSPASSRSVARRVRRSAASPTAAPRRGARPDRRELRDASRSRPRHRRSAGSDPLSSTRPRARSTGRRATAAACRSAARPSGEVVARQHDAFARELFRDALLEERRDRQIGRGWRPRGRGLRQGDHKTTRHMLEPCRVCASDQPRSSKDRRGGELLRPHGDRRRAGRAERTRAGDGKARHELSSSSTVPCASTYLLIGPGDGRRRGPGDDDRDHRGLALPRRREPADGRCRSRRAPRGVTRKREARHRPVVDGEAEVAWFDVAPTRAATREGRAREARPKKRDVSMATS